MNRALHVALTLAAALGIALLAVTAVVVLGNGDPLREVVAGNAVPLDAFVWVPLAPTVAPALTTRAPIPHGPAR